MSALMAHLQISQNCCVIHGFDAILNVLGFHNRINLRLEVLAIDTAEMIISRKGRRQTQILFK